MLWNSKMRQLATENKPYMIGPRVTMNSIKKTLFRVYI